MDKPLPKIGGITIERLPKPGSATVKTDCNLSGSSPLKKTANISPVVNLPPGISLQSSSNASSSRDFEEDYENYDEDVDEEDFDDGNEDGGENENHLNPDPTQNQQWYPTQTSGTPYKSPVLVSSEEEAGEVQNEGFQSEGHVLNTSDEMNESGSDGDVAPQPPFLPPGVTFGRKVPNATAAVKPNIQLPPGIQMERRKNVDAKPVPAQPVSVRPVASPQTTRGSLRQVRPQRNVNQMFPQGLGSLRVPTARAPPMRAVRPRASPQSRMMISDFLEQRMQIGSSPVGLARPRFHGAVRGAGVRAPRMPRAHRMPVHMDLMQNIIQNLPKPRTAVVGNVRPPIVKKPAAGIQLPPGISVQPRVVDVFLGGSDSDPEDDLPLVQKTPAQPLPKIPPGINFERKKVDRIERVKPLMKPEVEKEKPAFSNIQLPPGVTIDREKSTKTVPPSIQLPPGISFAETTPPAIQLPPGISFEKKKPSALEKSTVPEDFEDFEGEPNASDEEEEEYEESHAEDGLNNVASFQLPPGVSLERKSVNNEVLQTSESNIDFMDPPDNNLNEEENFGGVTSAGEGEEVAKVPLGIELPPGISLGKQTYEENYQDMEKESFEDLQDYPEDEDMGEGDEEETEENENCGIETGVNESVEGGDFGDEGMASSGAEDGMAGSGGEDGIVGSCGEEGMVGRGAHEEECAVDARENYEGSDSGKEDLKHEEEEDSSEGKMPKQDISRDEDTPMDESEEQGNEENDEDVEEGMEGAVTDSAEVQNELLEDKPGEIDFESLLAAPVIATTNTLSQCTDNDEEQDMTIKQEFEEKDVMQNLVEMMTKGEIEGEIEDDKEEEDEEKKAEKRKADDKEEDEDGVSQKKKQQLGDEEDQDEDGEAGPIDKSKVSSSHLRKNIREVMDETKLDETTLAAQRQEAERLKRLQEQQRILREVKRQIQLSKNAQKTQNQNEVLSMLRGNTETSILKKSSVTLGASISASMSSTAKSSNHVLLKMGNGQQTCLSDKMRELLKTPGKAAHDDKSTRNLLKQGMLSSSVTIAPIKREQVDDDDKKRRKGDVVTLSSDSDDDCIVLSEEEIESEPEEDPTNSGMHTADKYNILDEQGRVLVNTGHPPEEPDVFLAPQIARVIKPHQIGGIRFLYDNIIESTSRFESSAGFGCILAHSMGLGKTLQIVSFSDIFFRHTSGKKILCIMPINTIQNWQAEYNMWLPKENPNGADIRPREFDIYIVNESSKNIHARGKVILDWHQKGGVLLMGYELFRQLSLRKPVKSKRKRPDDTEDERNRTLVETIYCALVKPGPDLVICDEGHRIKNSHATTSQALKQIRTRRRVVLTGYPLQNNLLEYWCMVDFVRPNYLGSKTEFSNMFERPIQNGQCIDSTPQDKRLMRYRAHVLHSLLEGFVQRRSHAVLQDVLPQKEEYVLLLRFTSFQRKLYDTFMNEVVRTVAVPNPLKAFAVCCKIWNHPDVLYNFLKKKGEQRDLELEEPLPPTALPPRFPMDMGLGAPMAASNYPANAPTSIPWPKKGPGSRGGKVRQRKGLSAMNTPLLPPVGEKPRDPIPAINQFPGHSQNFRGHQDSSSYPAASASSANYPTQGNFSFPQQQPQQFAQHQPSSNNFQFQGPGYDENEQQMYGNNMFNSQQKMFAGNSQKQFKSNDFASNFGQEMGSNYYREQNQFSGPGTSSHFGSGNTAISQQYYPHNEMAGNSNFEYNQSTTDLTQDFSQMSGFSEPGFDSSNFNSTGNEFQQQNFWGNNWPSTSQGGYSGGSSGDEFISPSKFQNFDDDKKDHCEFGVFPGKTEVKNDADEKKHPTPTQTPTPGSSTPSSNPSTPVFKGETEDRKEDKKIEEVIPKKEDIPYDWASELFKNYVTGVVENSSKMEIFFLILTQSILRKDRMLVFSQSLLTLDLIEDYLQRRCVTGREETWCKNRNYFRLDGSTPALERERLINEFNINPNVIVFLVSTRAGSLGINLVGANRVVVFDASWNPCHDTQAVCRVYRYGQRKPCYVYRLVMDCCLEKKIYDRQINKQGMADRVVDELNPDAHLSLKEVTNLCWDDQEETSIKDFSDLQGKYHDDVVKMMLAKHSSLLSKAPFQHESLLIDRKEKKLSQAEKRLAKRSYELEKQAASQPKNLYQLFPSTPGLRGLSKPIASVKPMQNERFGMMPSRSKWIPAEVWQKQGMSAQEMTLPLDVVIPTNSPDKTSIVLKAGQRVMVLKSPKGIYMQLETGKIIAIRTAFKVGQGQDKGDDKKPNPITSALKNNPNVTITAKSSLLARGGKATPSFYKPSALDKKAAAVNMAASKGRIAVNNKNRPIPTIIRKTASVVPKTKPIDLKNPDTSNDLEKEAVESGKETMTTENLLSEEKNMHEGAKSVETSVGLAVKTNEIAAASESQDHAVTGAPTLGSQGDFGRMISNSSGIQESVESAPEGRPADQGGMMVPSTVSSASMMGPPSTSTQQNLMGPTSAASSMAWDSSVGQEMSRDIAKESLDSLNSLALSKESHASQPNAVKSQSTEFQFPAETKDGPEVKKDPDGTSPWPKQTYPMDPYGNYYPGYPGFYGPMPGYEGYPYPRGYPPPPVAIKTEAPEGTPPPATGPPPTAAAPPIYPPYPNPYPYPYNYPPFPPQAQAPAPTAASGAPKAADPTDGVPYVPPYTPRPAYPAPAPAPGFYPNYPPYRPYHDPNYPYPNYNPYMPHPPGYGYPMQGPHHISPHGGTEGTGTTAPPPADTPH